MRQDNAETNRTTQQEARKPNRKLNIDNKNNSITRRHWRSVHVLLALGYVTLRTKKKMLWPINKRQSKWAEKTDLQKERTLDQTSFQNKTQMCENKGKTPKRHKQTNNCLRTEALFRRLSWKMGKCVGDEDAGDDPRDKGSMPCSSE